MKYIFFILPLFLLSTASFGQTSLGAGLVDRGLQKNIFGENDRTTQIERQNLLGTRYIGKLFTAKKTACTASLVGKNLILTNAHCVSKNGEFVQGEYKFVLGYDHGNGVASSYVDKAWWGTLSPEDGEWQNDWAILRLEDPLGADHGYFGVTKNVNRRLPVSLAGYGYLFSVDYLTIHNSCNLLKNDRVGSVMHNCDISRGDSGAPMYRCTESGCYIQALHSAERTNGRSSSAYLPRYSKRDTNVAVETRRFYDFLVELKEAN